MWMTQKEIETLERDGRENHVSALGAELLARTMTFSAMVKDSKWKCYCGTNHYSVSRPTNCLTCGRIWK